MKLFIKRNKMSIIMFSILLLWLLITIIQYKQWFQSYNDLYDKVLRQCKDNSLTACDHLLKPYIPDTITVFFDLINNYSLRYVQLLAPLFVIVPAIWNFHSELKSGYIKNIMTRISYKKYIKKSIIGSLKNIWILPLFVVITFIAAYSLSGNFDFSKTELLYGKSLVFNYKYLEILPLFMSVFLTNIIFHSILYVNIGLIFVKKNMNVLVSIIISYLAFIALDIVFEIFIGGLLLAKIFNIHNITSSLNLFNIWVYSDIPNLSFTVVYSMMLAMLSLLMVFYIYKNKEEVIIENEK